MKQDGYVEKDLQEVYGFVYYHSAFEVCNEGSQIFAKFEL